LSDCRQLTPDPPQSSRQNEIFIASIWIVSLCEQEGTKNGGARFSDVATGGPQMLYYALVFLVVALIAGVLGFGGIAGASAGIAKILFAIFIILFLVSLAMRLFRQA
jgi:uncharacterized membrane protein YtjA (UPF0391 family)